MNKRDAFLLVLAVVAIVACRRHETVTVDGSTVQIQRNGTGATIRTAEGTVATGVTGAVLPKEFPRDIPIYPGGRITAAISSADQSRSGHVVSFETADPADQVAKFYAGKLGGWRTAMDMTNAKGRVLIYESGDGKRTLTLVANREGAKTTVALTAATKP